MHKEEENYGVEKFMMFARKDARYSGIFSAGFQLMEANNEEIPEK